MPTAAPSAIAERRFYSGASGLMLLTVFGGFAPTYFLKKFNDSPPLSGLLHVHGLLFTAWMILLVVQSLLVAGKNIGLHRRLGYAGAGLAVAMTLAGVAAGMAGARLGHAPPGVNPLSFLTVPLFSIAVFALLVAGGIVWRRDSATHKRLLYTATVVLLDPAIARMPFEFLLWHPFASTTCANLFWLALLVFDLRQLGQVHRTTLIAGGLLISQPIALAVGGTGPWLRFAEWLVK